VLNLFNFLPTISLELRDEIMKQAEYFPHTMARVLFAGASMTNVIRGCK
jgi:hypothetical protein